MSEWIFCLLRPVAEGLMLTIKFLRYLKSKFVWHDTSTFSGFLPLHIRETFDAPLPAHGKHLQPQATQLIAEIWNLHFCTNDL